VRERVPVQRPGAPSGQKRDEAKYTVREHERRFFIVPDLLAVPGATNYRVIADDYYVIVPEGADPDSPELRRAYLQYVVDPIVVRFNRDIAQRREQLKQLLDERAKAGASVTPDIFTAVSRSLVIAAEARLDEAVNLASLSNESRNRIDRTKDASARAVIARETQASRSLVEDETVAQLADAYEQGAVLVFYFADQLRGFESSGFDISNLFADMIASFDPARESRRLAEAAEARSRALVARRERQAQRQAARMTAAPEETGGGAAERAALIKSLSDVEKMLQLKDYPGAETRLKSLLQQFQGEPRIFFALGQTASLWARDTTDDNLQATRLNQALTHYRMAIERTPEGLESPLVCRAHEAMGRILAFLDRTDEAMKEFDAILQTGSSCTEALKEAARDGKRKLGQQ
jgi:tetratricopeptide (TPR) repeat protein